MVDMQRDLKKREAARLPVLAEAAE